MVGRDRRVGGRPAPPLAQAVATPRPVTTRSPNLTLCGKKRAVATSHGLEPGSRAKDASPRSAATCGLCGHAQGIGAIHRCERRRCAATSPRAAGAGRRAPGASGGCARGRTGAAARHPVARGDRNGAAQPAVGVSSADPACARPSVRGSRATRRSAARSPERPADCAGSRGRRDRRRGSARRGAAGRTCHSVSPGARSR